MDKVNVEKMDRVEFDNHVYSLFKENSYLLSIARKVDKLACSSISTMGVTQNPQTGRILFVYNPAFAGSLIREQLHGVILHEFYHIIFNHTISMIEDLGLDKDLANIVMDLEINQYIKDLPENCISFRLIKEKFGIDLPRERSWKFYYKKLKPLWDKLPTQSKSGSGKGKSGSDNGQFDDHDMDQDTVDELGKKYPKISGMKGKKAKDINKDNAFKEEKRKAQLRSAELQSQGKGIGSLPARVQNKLQTALDTTPFKPRWEKVLRMSVRRTIKSHRSKRTYLKRNKKLKKLKGRKKRRDLPNVLVAVDQSGSMDNNFLVSIAMGLNGLTKHCKMDLIPFDSVCYPEDLKHFEKGEKVKFDRVACGGTDFNHVSEYARSHNYDLIIILSDGEANKPKDLRGITRVYVIDRQPSFETRDKIVILED